MALRSVSTLVLDGLAIFEFGVICEVFGIDRLLLGIGVNQLVILLQRKRAEEALRDARKRLESALAAGAISTWSWDILTDRVVADAKLQEEAFAMARLMADGPTIALRYMKDNLDEALQFDFATARDHEAVRLVRTTLTADHREAVQAFVDKRKAVFTGK